MTISEIQNSKWSLKMKNISYIRNDLFEYFLDTANNILPRWYENKFELDYIKQEKLANVIANAMADSALYHSGYRPYWTVEPQKFEKNVHEKLLAIRKNKVNDLCVWYLSWYHYYVTQSGRYKKDSDCQHNHVINEDD